MALKIGKSGAKPAAKKTSPKDLAEQAVAEFEAQRLEYLQARQAWDKEFPDAKDALDEVKRLEDGVNDAIKAAKPLVAAAEVSVGDFKVQIPWSTETYDGEKTLEILCTLDDPSGGETLKELFKTGMVKSLVVDADVAKIVAGRDPDLKKLLAPAWKPSEKLTTRVTTPKL